MADETKKRTYSYPVYYTQGGGLVREVRGKLIFIEKPDCPGLDVGDEMPKEWGTVAANDLARDEMDDMQGFGQDFEHFVDLFEKIIKEQKK